LSALANMNSRMYETVRILGGPKTKVILQRPSDKTDPGIEFAYPRVLMRVKPQSIVKSTDILVFDGSHFLVADHSHNPDYRTHSLFECSQYVPWTRPAGSIHPVTGLETRDDQPTSLGSLWMVWQRQRREFADLPIRINQEVYLSLTGAAVELGDYVGGIRVTRVNHSLGVRILELQS